VFAAGTVEASLTQAFAQERLLGILLAACGWPGNARCGSVCPGQ
jgi:hypothetical protein